MLFLNSSKFAFPFKVDSADFDGTNDYMLRGADLTGSVDGKSGIFSAWLRVDGGNGTPRNIFNNGTSFFPRLAITMQTDNKIYIDGTTDAQLTMEMITTSAYTSSATWLHVLASWDLSTAGSGRLYINDVNALAGSPTYNNNNIRYTTGNMAIGADIAGSRKLNGCIAELYFAQNQYLDFSNSANRRKFISASGKPVSLGSDGSAPTGVAPIIYSHLDHSEAVAHFATNRGTGGDFSITGTLTTGSTSPSD